MLEEFINFANKHDNNKKYNLYNLALNHHNIKKIKQFRNVLYKSAILNKYYRINDISDEILFNEYYDFCYYYKYHSDIEEYHSYLKFIIDTINIYEN